MAEKDLQQWSVNIELTLDGACAAKKSKYIKLSRFPMPFQYLTCRYGQRRSVAIAEL
jgi:hypothetical protein